MRKNTKSALATFASPSPTLHRLALAYATARDKYNHLAWDDIAALGAASDRMYAARDALTAFACDIKNFPSETLAISKGGVLMDGQHRYRAMLELKKARAKKANAKKAAAVAAASLPKPPVRRKPGRPKKAVAAAAVRRGPGRPKMTDAQKASRQQSRRAGTVRKSTTTKVSALVEAQTKKAKSSVKPVGKPSVKGSSKEQALAAMAVPAAKKPAAKKPAAAVAVDETAAVKLQLHSLYGHFGAPKMRLNLGDNKAKAPKAAKPKAPKAAKPKAPKAAKPKAAKPKKAAKPNASKKP